MEKKYYAHSLKDETEEKWHLLEDHLMGTAEKAHLFTGNFDSGAWGDMGGKLHDQGKYLKAFLNMLRSKNGQNAHIDGEKTKRVIHSSAGALFACRKYGQGLGLPLAFVIAGHHAGLADKEDLKSRLDAQHDLLDKALESEIPEDILSTPPLVPPAFLQSIKDKKRARRSFEFWIRMLYSALVDADFLDTEEFYDRHDKGLKTKTRSAGDNLSDLKAEFDRYMDDFSESSTPVNRTRAEILEACREKALSPQGVFSLTAPTGSGKTLSAMAFALEHAINHGLERIIVVIPYTSIIEQNAKVYRKAFGKLGNDNLVEHHASLDPEKENHRNRLASENWDARVIVTTSVQFFESLLANRSSRCRKLHNISKSIVIFDEVQSLPIGHLIPIIDLLKELVNNYKVSIVLSTATQPALGLRSEGITQCPGFEEIREIVPHPEKTFDVLKRTEIVWPEKIDDPCSWEELATEIQQHKRVLVIVHRRDDARILTRLLPEGTFHLSRLMCAAHRLEVLEKIRNALADESIEIVRVVSTQLVEAGVDLDFPVVYRAFGGLDAVAQAAGRCNREGKIKEKGKVHIFVPPTRPPQGTPSKASDVAKTMLKSDPDIDPLHPGIFDRYFRKLYMTEEKDVKGIQRDREALKFKSVAMNFKMIEDDGSQTVVVPCGDAEKRLDELRSKGSSRGRLRSLQPFVVNLYLKEIRLLEDAGALDPTIKDTVRAIQPTHAYLYDDILGLVIEGHLAADPESLMT